MNHPTRTRLPQKRHCETHSIEVGNQTITASVGFDPTGRPLELFLTGAKDGSQLAAVLDDTSVTVSVALQFGVPASAMAKSVSRLPADAFGPGGRPASVIGAALDLLARYEKEGGAPR